MWHKSLWWDLADLNNFNPYGWTHVFQKNNGYKENLKHTRFIHLFLNLHLVNSSSWNIYICYLSTAKIILKDIHLTKKTSKKDVKIIHLNNRHQLPPLFSTEEHHVHEIFGFLVHLVTWVAELLRFFGKAATWRPFYDDPPSLFWWVPKMSTMIFMMIHHPYFGKYQKNPKNEYQNLM